MARYITVEGARCKVVESLGYNHGAGARATVVEHDGRERVAVGSRGVYRFWTARDRAAPLIEAIASDQKKRDDD